MHARTQNGPLSVELTGSGWQGKGLDAETSNGPVSLAIADGYSAELETGTRNGPMNGNFTVAIEGKDEGDRVVRFGRRIVTTLGKGGAPVRVVTTNGPLTISREGH